MKKFRAWLGQRLRFLADRIDDEHAFRATSFSFHFETGVGIVFSDKEEDGCPIWYYTPEYERAHRNG